MTLCLEASNYEDIGDFCHVLVWCNIVPSKEYIQPKKAVFSWLVPRATYSLDPGRSQIQRHIKAHTDIMQHNTQLHLHSSN